MILTEKLAKSETITTEFLHSDGWGYRVTCGEDMVVISYFEERNNLRTMVEQFTMPFICAKQVFQGIVKSVELLEVVR